MVLSFYLQIVLSPEDPAQGVRQCPTKYEMNVGPNKDGSWMSTDSRGAQMITFHLSSCSSLVLIVEVYRVSLRRF